VSIRHDLYNKDLAGARLSGSGWHAATMTARDLLTHHAAGLAWSVSIYRDGVRRIDHILETRVLALDIEPVGDTPALTLAQMESDNWLMRYVGFIAPTASHAPEAPRYRAAIILDRHVTPGEYAAIHAVFRARYPGQIDPGAKDAARFLYGAHQPGEFDGYVNDAAVLVVDDFLAAHAGTVPAVTRTPRAARHAGTATGVDWESLATIARRLNDDFTPGTFDGEHRDVLVMLDYAARLWSVTSIDYGVWLALWFAAWNASDGAATVRDHIFDDGRFWGGYGDDDRAAFLRAWDAYQPSDNPYSYGTLARLARLAGHVPDTFLVPEVTATADHQPRSLMLAAKTGAGKTNLMIEYTKRHARTLYIMHRRSLVTNVVNRLRAAGVTAHDYREGAFEPDSGGVLVTCIDSLIKVPSAARFDFIVLEEFAQWAGNFDGTMRSRPRAALRNYSRLCALVRVTPYAAIADGTAMSLEHDWFQALRGDVVVADMPSPYSKAPAYLHEALQGRAFKDVLAAYDAGRKVAVFADTATRAARLHKWMKKLRPDARLALVVSPGAAKKAGLPETVEDARQFIDNPNEASADIDRLIFNTAMATGVSIEHRYDDLFLLVSLWLPTNDYIQAANRTRNVGQRHIYLLPAHGNARPEESLRRRVERAQTMHQDYGLDFDTNFEGYIGARLMRAAGQIRQGRDMLVAFLKHDGIEILSGMDDTNDYGVTRTLTDMSKTELAALAMELDTVRAGEPGTPRALSTMAWFQKRFGKHDDINGEGMLKMLNDKLYERARLDTGDDLLHGGVNRHLSEISQRELTTQQRASELRRVVDRVALVLRMSVVFHRLDQRLTPSQWKARAPEFLKEVAKIKGVYDEHASEKMKFDTVTGDDLERAYKILRHIAQLAGFDLAKERNGGARVPQIDNLALRLAIASGRDNPRRLTPEPELNWQALARELLAKFEPFGKDQDKYGYARYGLKLSAQAARAWADDPKNIIPAEYI
jgi:hypothetical protein